MWEAQKTTLEQGTVCLYRLLQDQVPMHFKEVIAGWANNPDFRLFFIKLLQESPFEGFFWEVKPVNTEKLDSVFEFVLIDSPYLSKVRADKSPFHSHLQSEAPVVTFQNLGKDATLIVPTPAEGCPEDSYAHLARFVRNAPLHQVEALWQQVGEVYSKAIQTQPKWLSTSGLGVYWLHIRIDSYPKYYHYTLFKST